MERSNDRTGSDRHGGFLSDRYLPSHLTTRAMAGYGMRSLGSEEMMDRIEQQLEDLIEEVRKLIDAQK